MGRSTPSIQHSGCGKQETANAHRADPPACGAFFLTHWTKLRSRVTSSTKKAPGTINVSICILLKARTESVTNATPSAVFTGPPRTETTEHS
jgi:hypothetical protein